MLSEASICRFLFCNGDRYIDQASAPDLHLYYSYKAFQQIYPIESTQTSSIQFQIATIQNRLRSRINAEGAGKTFTGLTGRQ
ncbi:hypothetical protein DBV39_10565 [Orrella marina]|uniref:Uncharacterized protein n=1 Tax=Orrella marina TaxID=2163011 RepID=A0A2R4XJZ9_9BURK|nr:hypothetical protein DBV39_10565 [Orrella marina]